MSNPTQLLDRSCNLVKAVPQYGVMMAKGVEFLFISGDLDQDFIKRIKLPDAFVFADVSARLLVIPFECCIPEQL